METCTDWLPEKKKSQVSSLQCVCDMAPALLCTLSYEQLMDLTYIMSHSFLCNTWQTFLHIPVSPRRSVREGQFSFLGSQAVVPRIGGVPVTPYQTSVPCQHGRHSLKFAKEWLSMGNLHYRLQDTLPMML